MIAEGRQEDRMSVLNRIDVDETSMEDEKRN